MFVKVALARLSACACGFPALNPDIPLGTVYEIDTADTKPLTLICGGCKKHLQVKGIMVKARGDSQGGYLPVVIFMGNE